SRGAHHTIARIVAARSPWNLMSRLLCLSVSHRQVRRNMRAAGRAFNARSLLRVPFFSPRSTDVASAAYRRVPAVEASEFDVVSSGDRERAMAPPADSPQ